MILKPTVHLISKILQQAGKRGVAAEHAHAAELRPRQRGQDRCLLCQVQRQQRQQRPPRRSHGQQEQESTLKKMETTSCMDYEATKDATVLLNFGRTEKIWAVCGGKTNILPTSYQYTIHQKPMFCLAPHLLGRENVERTLIKLQ